MGTVSHIVGALTGKTQAQASEHAADTQYAASKEANATTLKMFNQTQENLQPYMTTGANALGALSNYTTTPSFSYDENSDPGTQFRLQEGVNALTASGAAAGNYGSGNMGTALVNYGQNLGSQEYQNAFNRWYNTQNMGFNQAYNIASLGENAAATLGSNALSTAQTLGTNTTTGANALATGETSAADYRTQGYQNIWNMLSAGASAGLSFL